MADTDLRNPELEEQIVADPRRADAYLVLGDWLQAAGDPRGELIALQYQARLGEAGARAQAAELLRREPRYFLGSMEEWIERGALEVHWGIGYIEAIRIWLSAVAFDDRFAHTLHQMLRAALTHPSARFLQRLTLEPRVDERLDAEILVERLDTIELAPTLRVLRIVSTSITNHLCRFVRDRRHLHDSLTSLDLTHGDMNDVGASVLLDCPELLARLLYLGIAGNDVPPETVAELAKAVSSGRVDA